MRKLLLDNQWPESFKTAWAYDSLEIFGDRTSLHYTMMYDNRYKIVLDLTRRYVRSDGRILDLAAAQGNYTLRLAEQGYRVTWNDLRAELADYVRLKYETGGVAYLPGNVFDIAACGQEWDCVLMCELLEHVAHPDQLLRHVANFVSPNGVLIVTTPNGEYFLNRLPKFTECPNPDVYEGRQFMPDSDGHIFLLTPREMEALASTAGLVILEKQIFTNPLSRGDIKLRYLHRLLPTGAIRFVEAVTRSLPPLVANRLHTHMAFVFARL